VCPNAHAGPVPHGDAATFVDPLARDGSAAQARDPGGLILEDVPRRHRPPDDQDRVEPAPAVAPADGAEVGDLPPRGHREALLGRQVRDHEPPAVLARQPVDDGLDPLDVAGRALVLGEGRPGQPAVRDLHDVGVPLDVERVEGDAGAEGPQDRLVGRSVEDQGGRGVLHEPSPPDPDHAARYAAIARIGLAQRNRRRMVVVGRQLPRQVIEARQPPEPLHPRP
jgi:hypothetical protein